MPTPSFSPFDVVAVPFPYVERETRKRRPAVVVAPRGFGAGHGLTWVVMVTSVDNRRWPDDILISDLARAGLPHASMVRPVKIATVELRRCSRLVRLDSAAAGQLRDVLATALVTATP